MENALSVALSVLLEKFVDYLNTLDEKATGEILKTSASGFSTPVAPRGPPLCSSSLVVYPGRRREQAGGSAGIAVHKGAHM
jgi:hypothetical protein